MGCSTSWRERAPLLNLHSQSSSRGPWSNCQCHCSQTHSWPTLAAPTLASSHAQSAISVCIDVSNCIALAILSHCIFVISLLWSWRWEWWDQLDLSEMPSSSYEGWLLSVSAEGRSTQANRWWAVGTPHLCYGHPWSEPWGCPAKAASYDRGYHQSHQENGTLL